MSRVLISGGAGFLGSHFCDRYLRLGYEVVCLDNLLSGTVENIRHLQGNPLFTFLQADVEALASLLLHKAGHRFEHVLHLASVASPELYLKHPLKTLSSGAEGTRAMLEVARKDSAVFLLASTSEVYGDPTVHPQPESYWGNVNSIGPRSVYDESKRFAEALTMAYHRTFGVDTRIVRIFNTYGPRMKAGDGRVIPNFINQALNGQPLTIYGNGEQTRSFCFYEDLLDGIIALIEKGNEMPVNIGNPDEYTMLELAEVVIQETGSTSRLVHAPLPQDDPKRRRPDISAARERLGWQPRVPLREGLAQTIQWFKAAKPLSAVS